MSDNSDPKEIIDTIENMLEERKTKGDRRQQSVPVPQERRTGKDRRDMDNTGNEGGDTG